jgi:ribosomal protein L37AE/L43A
MKTRVDNSIVANRILTAVRKDLLGEEESKMCPECDEEMVEKDGKVTCKKCGVEGNTTQGVPGVTADTASRAPGVVGNKGK